MYKTFNECTDRFYIGYTKSGTIQTKMIKKILSGIGYCDIADTNGSSWHVKSDATMVELRTRQGTYIATTSEELSNKLGIPTTFATITNSTPLWVVFADGKMVETTGTMQLSDLGTGVLRIYTCGCPYNIIVDVETDTVHWEDIIVHLNKDDAKQCSDNILTGIDWEGVLGITDDDVDRVNWGDMLVNDRIWVVAEDVVFPSHIGIITDDEDKCRITFNDIDGYQHDVDTYRHENKYIGSHVSIFIELSDAQEYHYKLVTDKTKPVPDNAPDDTAEKTWKGIKIDDKIYNIQVDEYNNKIEIETSTVQGITLDPVQHYLTISTNGFRSFDVHRDCLCTEWCGSPNDEWYMDIDTANKRISERRLEIIEGINTDIEQLQERVNTISELKFKNEE